MLAYSLIAAATVSPGIPAMYKRISRGRVEGSRPCLDWRFERAYWTIMGKDFMVGVGRAVDCAAAAAWGGGGRGAAKVCGCKGGPPPGGETWPDIELRAEAACAAIEDRSTMGGGAAAAG